MKNFTFAKLVRALLLSAVLAGCGGGDDNPAGGGGGNNIPVVDPNTVEKGSFTDSRDGQVYNTVKIGNQTWMSQNLNYLIESSWCYDNADSNCVKYGRLYGWMTELELEPTVVLHVRMSESPCPAGWKLPDTADWNRLFKAVGGRDSTLGYVSGVPYVAWRDVGNKLKSADDWDGTDDYGWSAMPGGQRGTIGNSIGGGSYSAWWAAPAWSFDMVIGGGSYIYSTIIYSGEGFVSAYSDHTDVGYYVRCVAD